MADFDPFRPLLDPDCDEDDAFEHLLNYAEDIQKAFDANRIRPHFDEPKYPKPPSDYTLEPFSMNDLIPPPAHGHSPQFDIPSPVDEHIIEEPDSEHLASALTQDKTDPEAGPQLVEAFIQEDPAPKAPQGVMADHVEERKQDRPAPKDDDPAPKPAKKSRKKTTTKAPKKKATQAKKADAKATHKDPDVPKLKDTDNLEERFAERQKRLQDILDQDKGKVT